GEDKILHLSDFKGKSIILAFIDSTKSPSGKIAETLNEVYPLKEDGDLKVIAVDISGSEKALEKFADKYQIDFTIAPDRKGKIREEYSLDADMPAIYIISSDGIIRQIYTGYFAGFKEHLIEDLRFIESAGYSGGNSHYLSEQGLSLQWNHKVKVTDFDAKKGKAATLTPSNKIDIISSEGKAVDIFKLSESPADRILAASGEDDFFYLVYKNGMNNIRSYSDSGKLLWETSAEYPISDIKIISGTGSVKIIAALNGPSGPVCLSGEGEVLWVSEGPLYTSRVAAGAFDGGGRIAAITNSGDTLHILDINGKSLSTAAIKHLYADYIEAVPFGDGKNKSTLFIAGNSGGNKILRYLKEDFSESSWETILGSPGSSDITGISPHPHKDIYAVTVNNGSLYLFNREGKIAAEKENLGFGVKSGWMELEKNYYLLLTGSVDKGLSAYSADIKE
ncbi:MAG: TlpA disulfide reductase family protein, partial [Elusimicrobiota bacterium]|nr:TlpA disulfide reductase family protein [Elusimicrobiota bacterium]